MRESMSEISNKLSTTSAASSGIYRLNQLTGGTGKADEQED